MDTSSVNLVGNYFVGFMLASVPVFVVGIFSLFKRAMWSSVVD